MDVLKLPVEHWDDYRALRLRALKEDPQAFSSAYADAVALPEEAWKKRLADAWNAERNWLLFARQGVDLIGMIGAYIEDESSGAVTVVSVYVPKENRGAGVASRLMRELLLVLSDVPSLKQARLRVNLTQHAAVQLYRRFGFLRVGLEPSTTGAGQLVQQLLMQRELPYRVPD